MCLVYKIVFDIDANACAFARNDKVVLWHINLLISKNKNHRKELSIVLKIFFRSPRVERIKEVNPKILFMAAFDLRAQIKIKHSSILCKSFVAQIKDFAINWTSWYMAIVFGQKILRTRNNLRLWKDTLLAVEREREWKKRSNRRICDFFSFFPYFE